MRDLRAAAGFHRSTKGLSDVRACRSAGGTIDGAAHGAKARLGSPAFESCRAGFDIHFPGPGQRGAVRDG
jgi:hypothetical protein